MSLDRMVFSQDEDLTPLTTIRHCQQNVAKSWLDTALGKCWSRRILIKE